MIVVAGDTVLAAIPGQRRHGAERMSLALCLGAGVVSLLLFWASLVAPGRVTAWWVIIPVFSAFAIRLAMRGWPDLRQDAANLLQTVARLPRTGTTQLVAVAFFAVASFAGFASTIATGMGYDGLVIWNHKALLIYVSGGFPVSHLVDYSRQWTHLDYPLLIPLGEAWFYMLAGPGSEAIVKTIFACFYIALLGLIYSVLRPTQPPLLALLFTAAIGSVPALSAAASDGYADLAVGTYWLGSAVYMYRWLRTRCRGDAVLVGLLVALASWTKNEGLVFSIVQGGILLLVLVAGRDRREAVRALLYLLGAAAAIAGPWAALLLWYRVPRNDYLPVTASNVLGHVDRLPGILAFALGELGNEHYWGWLFYLFAAAVMVAPLPAGDRLRRLYLVLAVSAALAGLALPYILSVWEPYTRHVETSFFRLVLQQVPLVGVFVALQFGDLIQLAVAAVRRPSKGPPVPTEGVALRGRAYHPDTAVGALVVALFAVSITLTLAAVTSYALELVGLSIQPMIVPLVGVLTLGVAGWSVRRTARFSRSGVLDVLGALAVGSAFLGYSLWLAWPTLYPTSVSENAVHSLAIADSIYRSGHLDAVAGVAGSDMTTGTTFASPAYLLVAQLAWTLGISPLAALHPSAALVVAFTAILVYAIILELLVGQTLRRPIAIFGAASLFWAPSHVFGQFTKDFQIVDALGTLLFVVALYWLIRFERSGQPMSLVLAGAVMLVLAPTAPLWAAPLCLAALAVLVARRPRTIDWPVITFAAIIGAAAVIGAVYLGAPARIDSIEAQTGLAVASSGLDTLGVPLLALALVGIRPALRSDRLALALVVAIAGLGLETAVAQRVADAAAIPINLASEIWYPVVPLMAVVGSQAVASIAQRLTNGGTVASRRSIVGLTLLAISFLSVIAAVPGSRPGPSISPDLYAASLWAKDHLGEQRIAYVTTSWFAPVWIHNGILRRADLTPGTRLPPTTANEQSYEDWYYDSTQPDYAIADRIPQTGLRDAELLYRSGSAAVLKRPPAERLTPAIRIGGEVPVQAGGNLTIVSYQPPSRHAKTNEVLTTRVRLRVARDTALEYVIASHLNDQNGKTWSSGERTMASPGLRGGIGFGTPTLETTVDVPMTVRADTPSGPYNVELFVLSRSSHDAFKLRDATTGGERVLIVGATVIPPEGSIFRSDQVRPRVGSVQRLGDHIRLLGYDAPAAAPQAGGSVPVTLYWESLSAVDKDYTVFVQLLDPSGNLVAQSDSYPAQGRYPTSFWRQGQIVRDEILLRIPPNLPAGRYRLIGGMYLLETMERLAVSEAGRSSGDALELGSVDIGPGR